MKAAISASFKPANSIVSPSVPPQLVNQYGRQRIPRLAIAASASSSYG